MYMCVHLEMTNYILINDKIAEINRLWWEFSVPTNQTILMGYPND